MKVYVSTINGGMQKEGFTSLRTICESLKVSYASAIGGKRVWATVPKTPGNITPRIVQISEIDVIRIKGRGRKKAA